MIQEGRDMCELVQRPTTYSRSSYGVQASNKALENHRIMLCAPTNKAVQTLVSRFIDEGWTKNEIVVVGNAATVKPEITEFCLEYRIKQLQELGQFKDELLKTPEGPDRLAREQEYRRLHQEATGIASAPDDSLKIPIPNAGALLSNARLIACTVSCSARSELRDIDTPTIIMDEAAQCTEAASLVVASRQGLERLVMVGDPRQLPALVMSQEARRCNYDQSAMERVMHSTLTILLDTQYRMHPEISRFPNERYYGAKLRDAKSVLSRTENRHDQPFLVVDVRGIEEMEFSSYFNRAESQVVCHEVAKICKKLPKAEIGVITPYQAQRRLIAKDLAAMDKDSAITVNTVDGFQGAEFDVVLLSMVRSNRKCRVGFVDDAHRLNVALTRAKSVLRVIGNVKTFDGNRELGALVRDAEARGLIAKPQLPSAQKQIGLLAQMQPETWCAGAKWEDSEFRTVLTDRFMRQLAKMSAWMRQRVLDKMYRVAIGKKYKSTKLLFPQSSKICFAIYVFTTWCVYTQVQNPPRLTWYTIGRTLDECRRLCATLGETAARDGEATLGETAACGGEVEHVRLDNVAIKQQPTYQLDTALVAQLQHPNTDILAFFTAAEMELTKDQEKLSRLPGPLVMIARSGTGKTNVLLHRLVRLAQSKLCPSLLFVTRNTFLNKKIQEIWEQVQITRQITDCNVDLLTYDEMACRLVIEAMNPDPGRDPDLEPKPKLTDFGAYWQCCSQAYRSTAQVLPTQMHTEINSLILGGELAADQKGSLDKAQYLELTSLQPSDASTVYKCYCAYRDWKKQLRLVDIADVTLLALAHTQMHDFQKYSAVFVDEVQDFTPSELCLILRHIENPHSKFAIAVAGDTAQTITPGCTFRFQHFQALAYRKSGNIIRIPEQHTLLQNFRTHQLNLKFSNYLVEAIHKLFPGKIDKLPPEHTLVCRVDDHPALFVCNDEAALAGLLLGADQCVLVRSASLQASIQRHLPRALVMTIEECKGLEYDDILLVNFFSGSDFKRWHLLSRVRPQESNKTYRGLKPSDDTLRLELQLLYVAVTRAQKRLILVETDDGIARTRHLRQQIPGVIDYSTGNTLDVLPLRLERLSSPDDWARRGKEFYDRRLYSYALTCFRNAKDKVWQTRCQARMLLARDAIGDEARTRKQSEAAAALFMSIHDFEDAAWLFERAGNIHKACEVHVLIGNRRHDIAAARLYWKDNEYVTASTLFLKHNEMNECFRLVEQRRSSMPTEIIADIGTLFKDTSDFCKAAHCYEWAERYGDAAKEYLKAGNNTEAVGRMLWQAHLFDRALQTWLAEGIEVWPRIPNNTIHFTRLAYHWSIIILA